MNLNYYAPKAPLHFFSERAPVMDNEKKLHNQDSPSSNTGPAFDNKQPGLEKVIIETMKFSENLNRLFTQWFPSKQQLNEEALLDSIYLNNLISPDSKIWVKFTLSHIILCTERSIVSLCNFRHDETKNGLLEELDFVQHLTESILEYLDYASKVISSYALENPMDADESREITRDLLSRIYRENEIA